MNKKFFISTPIYYSSGKPHIGHAYTTLIADALAKYKKIFGYDVFFVTGMDEHGQKIQEKALELNLNPKSFVDKISLEFLALWKKLKIDYSFFIRTTQMQHEESVQKAFSILFNKDKIYLDEWKGFYCVSCEENYALSDIKTDECGNKKCTLGHSLVEKKEESYFYKMKESADFLKQYYKDHPQFIIPKDRVNELLNNFINNLEDLSISRTSFDWGIPIKENPKHVIYVWLDALLNYVTATGYLSDDDSLFKKFWEDENTEIVHLLSKEITRFHCIHWPIFLKDLGIRLPTTILSHGWIVTKEGKMSKSLGNVIDPVDVINKYGVDAFRFYVLSELPVLRGDSVFSYENLEETYNTNLANNYGNMVSRTLGMLKKYTDSTIPLYVDINSEWDIKIQDKLQKTIKNTKESIDSLLVDKAIANVIDLLYDANKYIEELKPWELYKNNNIQQLHNLLFNLTKVIQLSTILLSPILVEGYVEVQKQMNFNDEILKLQNFNNNQLLQNHKVLDSQPIFVRINNKEK